MIHRLKELIIEKWETLDISSKRPSSLNILQMENHEGGVLLFIFKDRDKFPFAIAKIGLNEKSKTLYEKEFYNLSLVWNSLPIYLRKTIPRPLFEKTINGYYLFLETGLKGKRRLAEDFKLKSLSWWGKKRFKEFLKKVVKWLIEFHKATKKEVEFTESHIEEFILKPIEDFKRIYAVKQEEETFFKVLSEKAGLLLERKIPLVFSHNDFWLGNILKFKEEIMVTDWELLQKDDLPLIDLLMLFSTLIASKDDDNPGSFKYIYLEENWFSKLRRNLENEYLGSLGIDSEIAEILFYIFLIRMSIRVPFWRNRLLSTHISKNFSFSDTSI